MADPLAEDQLVEATAGMGINEAPRRLYWKKELDELGAQLGVELPIQFREEQPNWPLIVISSRNFSPQTPSLLPETFVFLGEGNFTFCTAFAAYRGSWLGIVPTNYYANGAVPADMQQAWNETIALNLQNSQNWQPVQNLQNMPAPPRRHLDATNMGTRDDLLGNMGIPETSVITLWFQCPWHLYTASFLKHIFSSAAWVQNEGELFLVGLCVDGRYVREYGQVTAAAGAAGYKCLGADQEFVGKMIAYGYQHTNWNNESIGLNQNNQFATLLFRRDSRPASCVYIDGTVWPNNEVHVMRSPDGLGIEIFSNGQSSETLTSDQWLQLKTEINIFFENQEWIAQKFHEQQFPELFTQLPDLQLHELITQLQQPLPNQQLRELITELGQQPQFQGQQFQELIARLLDRPLDRLNTSPLLENTEFIVEDGKLIYRRKHPKYKLSVISCLEWRNKSSQIDQLFEQQ